MARQDAIQHYRQVSDDAPVLGYGQLAFMKDKRVMGGDSNSQNFTIGSVIGTESFSAGGATIGDVAGGHYFKVEADGTWVAMGNATTYDDFPPQNVINLKPGTNAPDSTTIIGTITGFTFKTGDSVHFTQEMLHGWKEGSTIELHVHGITNGTNTDVRYVKVQFEYIYANANAAFPTASAFLSTTFPIPANTPSHTHFIAAVGTINMSGGTIGGLLMTLFSRETATGSAPTGNPFFAQLGVHREADTAGSRHLYTK